ncbi:MAG: hypothetical protein LUF87_08700 [Alistipes sp.]|nr:hypothetical protein [Alistipes sp.]
MRGYLLTKTASGRIVVTSAGQEINTFITDHLGSVRAIRNSAGNIEAVAEYYPYGLKWSGAGLMASTNRWLYNGKELQDAAGLDLLDYGARMYDAFKGSWNGRDDLAEKYFQFSPYSFVGNNTINRIDPDGRDWHSYNIEEEDDKGNKISTRKYKYSDYELSEGEIKAQGLTPIGLTGYTADGSKYLGLFGHMIDIYTENGNINLTAEMAANIDQAIINSYKADFYNDPVNRDPFDQEMYSGATNMSISIHVTPEMVSKGAQVFSFNYVGGKVRYEASNLHDGWSFSWGKGEVTTKHGYFINLGSGVFSTISQGRNEVVNWIFPTVEAWQNARNKTDKLLKNRSW